MIRLEMRKYNMILTEKQQKYQPYHLAKIDKYEYLTGEEILPSNQQQIIEQTKFTYSLLRKAFEKQIKTIVDQGEKQVEALKCLKPKEQKEIEDKPNNQSRATLIINDLIDKRKSLLNELHENVDKNNLKCEYVGPNKGGSFYEYIDSKELF